MIRYRVQRLSGRLSRPLKVGAAMRMVRRRARAYGSPWRIRRRGSAPGRPHTDLAEVLGRFRTRLEASPVGEVLVLVGAKGEVGVRVVEVEPPIIQTEGNSKVDAIYTAVLTSFKGIVNMGICNRRVIDGTNDWTQHCPWAKPDPGSNALDIGARFWRLKRIATFLVVQGEVWAKTDGKEGLPVGRVIFNRQIWDPVRGWHAYSGTNPHTGHIHAEGTPSRTGTPRSSCP